MSKKLKFFIDPGHGGHDPGAIGTSSKEAENVLKVALALEEKLISQGHEVKLSRRTDTYLTLTQRANLANAWGADVFISLHDNSAVNKTATGFETFIFSNFKNKASEQRAVNIQTAVHKVIAKGIGLRDRGMKRANFAVLRETAMVALLIEYGFISNLNDEKVIAFEIEKQAQLTMDGINSYLGVKPKPVVVTPAPKTEVKEESDEIMLTVTGRNAIRDLLKKARNKTYTINGKSEPLIDPTIHTDAKINQYSDVQLLSYQAAVINRTF